MIRPNCWKTFLGWSLFLWITPGVNVNVHIMALQTPTPISPTAKAKATSKSKPIALNFPGAFDMDRMDALVQRGEVEAVMMQAVTAPPLLAPALPTTVSAPFVVKDVPTKARASAGFGVGSSSSSSSTNNKKSSKSKASQKKKKTARTDIPPVLVPTQQPQPEQDPLLALSVTALQQDGVVRLNNVLSSATAAFLKEDVLSLQAAAYAAVLSGDDWRTHFADVLLKGSDSTRCDLLLPLTGNRAVQMALKELLLDDDDLNPGKVSLGSMLETAIGEDATLYELSVLISEPGSARQPVHPDNPYQEHVPLLTCFVALQDITVNMGPTTFIPNTHTATAHADFESVATRDAMLENMPSQQALLSAGDASLFDSRTLHCAGANDSNTGSTRAVMCLSFRNPWAVARIGNVGSIRQDIKRYTLSQLRRKLAKLNDDNPTMDPFDKDHDDDDNDETEAMGMFRLAAAKGDADAMFNLGLCYKNGEHGVEKDAATAFRWFQCAAEPETGTGTDGHTHTGHVTAQCNLAVCYYTGEGVSQDDVEAVRWFELAAMQGLAAAQHNLGFCYATGTGVTLDLARAAVLFEQAAAQGHPGAEEFYEEVTKQ